MDNTREPEDDLKANNALLKLKLELDHGMMMDETEGLHPEAENQWLQYICNFEKLSKETPPIKVYDYIGRPPFIPLSELTEINVRDELKKLEELLNEKGVALDCCCEYGAGVIYQFITEELFEHEMDGIRLEGMVHQFIYEEFHPNNDYDIRRLVSDFIEGILKGTWNEQFDSLALAETVSFNEINHSSSAISSIINAFQEKHPLCVLGNFMIEDVNINIETGKGKVKANLVYTINDQGKSLQRVDGECIFEVVLENGYWNICLFKVPGFSLM